MRFRDVGLDGLASDQQVPRSLTFTQDGPGTVSASVTSVESGRVELCLGRGEDGQGGRECTQGGSVEVTTDSAGPDVWTVTASGASAQVSPVDISVSFTAEAPRLRIAGFRFQGSEFAPYNGFDATVQTSASGAVSVDATWGAVRPFRSTIGREGGEPDEVAGEDDGVLHEVAADGGTAYRLIVRNEVAVDEEALFVSATISWP